MPNSGIVGPVKYIDGTTVNSDRYGRFGDKIVSELQGRYYENCSRGNIYFACSQAVATTTVGLATTYTGLCLSNPIGSATNIALLWASVIQSVVQATQIEGYLLATGSSSTTNVTHTTPGTVYTGLVGAANNNSVAKVDTAATLTGTPVYTAPLTNTATSTQNGPGEWAEFAGMITLAPGGYVCFATPTQASVAGLWLGFVWAEVTP